MVLKESCHLKEVQQTFAEQFFLFLLSREKQFRDQQSGIFQEVAKRVGTKQEMKFLNQFNYGNKDISGGRTNFWLQFSLQISPREQVEFLKRFYTHKLPIHKKHINTVKKILVQSESNGAVLSGKTGTGRRDAVMNGTPINGNFIGYVEEGGNVYLFATNIEADDLATGGKTKEITIKILQELKIYHE